MDGRSLPFRKFSFMDMSTCTHYILYNQAYLMGLILQLGKNCENSTPQKFPTIQ